MRGRKCSIMLLWRYILFNYNLNLLMYYKNVTTIIYIALHVEIWCIAIFLNGSNYVKYLLELCCIEIYRTIQSILIQYTCYSCYSIFNHIWPLMMIIFHYGSFLKLHYSIYGVLSIFCILYKYIPLFKHNDI